MLKLTACVFLALFGAQASFAELSVPRMPTDALPLPIVRQATDYSCGPGALLSVLYYWGVYDGTETALYRKMQTTAKEGTEPPMIAQEAESRGLRTELRTGMTLNDLREALVLGQTVILDIQAWRDSSSPQGPWQNDWEDGHYVVLAGMDQEYAYFMDPSAGPAYGYMPLSELMDRWHDYEDRHGYIQRYVQCGIVIQGTHALESFPDKLVRIE